jgi:hypothetical protein
LSPRLSAQNSSFNSLSSVLSVTPPEKIVAKRDQLITADFLIQVKSGYHVNSDKPADEYLIPLKLTWTDGIAKAQEVIYPKPSMEKFAFSPKSMSVFQGDFKTQTKFKISGDAPPGLSTLTGKLRYQACNDRMCLPPRTLDVKVPLEIRN